MLRVVVNEKHMLYSYYINEHFIKHFISKKYRESDIPFALQSSYTQLSKLFISLPNKSTCNQTTQQTQSTHENQHGIRAGLINKEGSKQSVIIQTEIKREEEW